MKHARWLSLLPLPNLLPQVQNEEEVAAAVAASGIPREQVFITSKVSPYEVRSSQNQLPVHALFAVCLFCVCSVSAAAGLLQQQAVVVLPPLR